ncbi:MAG: Rid family detoxifying hydrolase [Legionellaceae bacterium]|nr:Rid family detoxifying hydrolase [Legionellaceae bacterium]
MRDVVETKAAPEAIGTYSQAVRFGDVLYISGQIPLHPETMVLSDDSMEAQVNQVFDNLSAICEAASGSLAHILKLTVYLIDLSDIATVNQAMERYFSAPFPARVAFEVSALPRGARVEIDAVMACQ